MKTVKQIKLEKLQYEKNKKVTSQCRLVSSPKLEREIELKKTVIVKI
jgi:hypothetical protein